MIRLGRIRLPGGVSVPSLAIIACMGACSSTPAASGREVNDGGPDATLPDASDGGQPTEAGPPGSDAGGTDAGSTDVPFEATSDSGDGAATDATADVTDAPADSPPMAEEEEAANTEPCTGVTCNGQCLAASDCRTCTGATLLCAPSSTCVSSCSGCGDSADAAMPIECFSCDPEGLNPLGTCQPDNPSAYCLNGRYASQYVGGANGYVCSCDDAGMSCPGKTQVCTPLGQAMFCLTCGEISTVSRQDAGCQGGGTCNASTHSCQ